MTDLIKLYNPANAAALTPEQIQGLQSLTKDQIKELAKAYPNSSTVKAYLLIIDGKKPADKQLPQLSTFENLYNLMTKNRSNFVAFGFRGGNKPVVTRASRVPVRRTEILDLSDKELMTLPGFRTGNKEHAGEQVEVTKVKTKIPATLTKAVVDDANTTNNQITDTSSTIIK